MKSVEFCYWLQGMFELGNPQSLDAAQTDLVKRHLAMVFKHEIDPSYGKAEAQAALSALHQGSKPVRPPDSNAHSGDVLLRC
jgi:hypothetical protein